MPYYNYNYSPEVIADFADRLRSALAEVTPELGQLPSLTEDKAEKIIRLLGGELCYKENWDDRNGIGVIRPCVGATTSPKFIIEVPQYTHTQRNMFTIAHEIGHLFLHLGYNTERWSQAQPMFRDTTVNNITTKFHAAEWEANEFAACYLMPEKEFRIFYKECAGDVACIAQKLYVSQSAVRVRIQSINKRLQQTT